MLEVLKTFMPLVAGLLAAWIATRNARKTPHDNLKALVDIDDKLKLDDQKAIVGVSIDRELKRLDRLNRSREEPFYRWLWIQLTNRPGEPFTAIVWTSLAVAVAISYDIYNTSVNGSGSLWSWVGSAFGGAVIILALISAYLAYRISKGVDGMNEKAQEALDEANDLLGKLNNPKKAEDQ